MGERNRDRQLREARTAYVAAVRRLDKVLQAFDASGAPMDPGPNPADPLPWTPEQRLTIRRTAAAFVEVCERRDEWDGLRRDFQRLVGEDSSSSSPRGRGAVGYLVAAGLLPS